MMLCRQHQHGLKGILTGGALPKAATYASRGHAATRWNLVGTAFHVSRLQEGLASADLFDRRPQGGGGGPALKCLRLGIAPLGH